MNEYEVFPHKIIKVRKFHHTAVAYLKHHDLNNTISQYIKPVAFVVCSVVPVQDNYHDNVILISHQAYFRHRCSIQRMVLIALCEMQDSMFLEVSYTRDKDSGYLSPRCTDSFDSFNSIEVQHRSTTLCICLNVYIGYI